MPNVSKPSRTPKKQSTLPPTESNKKALNLKVVEEKIGRDMFFSNNLSHEKIHDEEKDNMVKHELTTDGDPSQSSSDSQSKATLSIKQKHPSPKTPKSVKTLKTKDDTRSSKKKKNDSTKRKRTNDCEVIDLDDTSHFISTKGKQNDEIIGSIASIFLTKEQRQRKKEIETLTELQKTHEKRKEINSIFCVQGAEHPLMKINKEKKKEMKESKTKNEVDLKSWQGVEPLQCNITTENLREFGFCQNVGFSQLSINQPQLTINVDDLLSFDSLTIEKEYSFENHPNTLSIIHKLSQLNEQLVERSSSIKIESVDLTNCFNNNTNSERILFEETCFDFIEGYVENLYPQSLWNESKRKGKQLLKKSLDKKYISQPQIVKVMDLENENSLESTNNIDISHSKKDTLDDLWSIKYKPNCFEHIISKNDSSNQTLLEWLEKWRSPSLRKQTKRKDQSTKKRKTKKTSDDLFTDDEDDSDDELEKCILLYGPTSGKSSSLHAIANQLGFEIMEVNSTCERSSKSIMELRETTQSKGINSMGKIIVFEDADLKFQEESYSSFIGSIEKLEKSTKRPIILISDFVDENSSDLLNSICKHRVDFCCREPFTMCTTEKINQHCKYIFDICIYIYSIMLCEGTKFDIERDLFPLVVFFAGDLKKILLHLQFWFYRANSTPNIPQKEFHSDKSLLEQVLGLDKSCYYKTIDNFRRAEDDIEIMKELDIPFYNYLNNSNHINNNFMSTLSEADRLRRFDNEFSCKVSISDFGIALRMLDIFYH